MMLATNRLPIKTLNIEVAESMPISVAYGPLPPRSTALSSLCAAVHITVAVTRADVAGTKG